jgi:hypothetical protein
MKKVVTILFVLGGFAGFAQAPQPMDGRDSNVNMRDMSSGGMFRSFDNRFKGIQGYPTLFELYHPGQIIMVSGMKVDSDSVNLDVYNNDLLVKRNRIETIVNKTMVAGFSIETPQAIRYFTKLRDNDGTNSFYEVLAKGKINLFKRTVKTIKGPTKVDAYSNGNLYSEFEEKAKLFIQKTDGSLVEIKNKKNLIETFPDQEAFITKFIKENKTNIRKESDCVDLIKFVNTL